MDTPDRVTDLLVEFPGPVTLRLRPNWIKTLAAVVFGGLGMLDVLAGNWWGWLILGSSIVLVLPLYALCLHADGFDTVTMLHHRLVRWQEASGFTAAKVGREVVSFDLTDDAGEESGDALHYAYGLTPDELACLLRRWRELAVSAGSRPPSAPA